ncbi:MAG: 16S rRNA (cytosine(967)-C(5))-methyltransferase RsmB [candidate division Zixibacteria bacterium]|nr:16S rRNA (cytosine(967)-C(5))-methyltransferase RsmB [candidate division Zixibacteria bacterium]
MTENKKKYDPVRAAAIEILGHIETEGDSSEESIRKITDSLPFSNLDLRFIRQLVNGTVKMKRRLDHDYRFYLTKPSGKMAPELINILRLGFFQLFYTDRIPDAAAVSESVNLARHFCNKSQSRLVNAVLRSAIRQPDRVVFVSKETNPIKYLADFYSYPEWFVSHCLEEFKYEKTELLLDAMNKPPHFTFRVNLVKSKVNEVTDILDKEEYQYHPGMFLSDFIQLKKGGIPPSHELIKSGHIYIQDESAGLAVKLLNPKTKMRMLDMAAAPGGKAIYAAVRMRNKGMITALDKSRPRLELMMENVSRQGIKIVNPVHADALEFQSEAFSRVLLDVPCSGWGNAGKHSDLRWQKHPEDIERLVKIQSMMIDKAAKLVKPGGILVYSTCTILRKENDQVIEEFLLRRKDFTLESATDYLDDEIVSERGFMKTYPNIGRLSGAFAARLKKIVH